MTRLLRALGALALVSLFAAPALAADPIPLPGTSWSGSAVIGAKISGAGKVGGPVTFDLDFGPQADPLLAEGEFLLVLDDGMEDLNIGGSYTVDAKGRPVLSPDTSALAVELEGLMMHICVDVLGLSAECTVLETLDLSFDPSKLKIKLKAKERDGVETLLGAGRFPFVLLDGIDAVERVSIVFKTNPDVAGN